MKIHTLVLLAGVLILGSVDRVWAFSAVPCETELNKMFREMKIGDQSATHASHQDVGSWTFERDRSEDSTWKKAIDQKGPGVPQLDICEKLGLIEGGCTLVNVSKHEGDVVARSADVTKNGDDVTVEVKGYKQTLVWHDSDHNKTNERHIRLSPINYRTFKFKVAGKKCFLESFANSASKPSVIIPDWVCMRALKSSDTKEQDSEITTALMQYRKVAKKDIDPSDVMFVKENCSKGKLAAAWLDPSVTDTHKKKVEVHKGH